MKYFYTLLLLITVAFAQDTVIVVGGPNDDNMDVPAGTDVGIFYPQGGRDYIRLDNCAKCIIMMPSDGPIMTTPYAMTTNPTCDDARFHQVRHLDWGKTFIHMGRLDSLYGHIDYADIEHFAQSGHNSEYVRVRGDSCYSLGGLRILANFTTGGPYDPSVNIIRDTQTTFNIVLEDEEEEVEDTTRFERPFTMEYYDLAGRRVENIRSENFANNTLAVRVLDARGQFIRAYLWMRYR